MTSTKYDYKKTFSNSKEKLQTEYNEYEKKLEDYKIKKSSDARLSYNNSNYDTSNNKITNRSIQNSAKKLQNKIFITLNASTKNLGHGDNNAIPGHRNNYESLNAHNKASNTLTNVGYYKNLLNGNFSKEQNTNNYSKELKSYGTDHYLKNLDNQYSRRENLDIRDNSKIDTTKLKWYGSASDFINIRKEVEFGLLLGKGSFATVYRAYDYNTKLHVAVKVYDKKNLLQREKKQFVQTEVDIMSVIDHRNIAKFYRVLEDMKSIYIVQENCGEKSLSEYVKKSKNHRLDENEAKIVFSQFAASLKYIHSKNVCHRDLKLTNILIEKFPNRLYSKEKDDDTYYRIKMIDFGFACFSNRKFRTYCGTPSYMAPELVSRISYDGIQVDIWASGVILYKILTGGYPFGSEKDKELERRIKNVEYSFPDYVSEPCKDLIRRCLTFNPKNRITAKEIEQHPWLTSNLKFPQQKESENNELDMNECQVKTQDIRSSTK